MSLETAGLFAGIGGIELGLAGAGHRLIALVEKDEIARSILKAKFRLPVIEDVRSLTALPRADLVVAGFPCTDLSQAGRTNGIDGQQSGLVKHLFTLLRATRTKPRFLLLENVPFMLRLHKGRAMRFLIQSLEETGYRWAYRVVNTQGFGLPQRRRRVFLVAARDSDPKRVLFADDAEPPKPTAAPTAYGFYWTEGNRGLGWAVDSLPPLKGGSGVSIPSPPAIWFPDTGRFDCPEIRDAERLQGFEPDWTRPAEERIRLGHRWLLVGNAVSVPVARWIGERLAEPGDCDHRGDEELADDDSLPDAAWGQKGRLFRATVGEWPVSASVQPLRSFLEYPVTRLSERAAAGFLGRARRAHLHFEDGFLDALDAYVRHLRNGKPDKN